jgi:hypothetical protein
MFWSTWRLGNVGSPALVLPRGSHASDSFLDLPNSLREALGPNSLLMVDLVPELMLIMGELPAVDRKDHEDFQKAGNG